MTRANPTPPRLRPRTRFGARRRVALRREPQPPSWRPAPPRARWRAPEPARTLLGFPAFWLGSIAAHLLVAALLLFWPDPRPQAPDQMPPPSFDIVFEGGQPEQPVAEPMDGVEAPPQPPAPPNQAPVPPPPSAPPVPSQPAMPPMQQALPLPPPVPQPPAPPVQQALPAPPIPAPPVPDAPASALAPLPPLPGAVELFTPRTELRLPDRLAESLPPPPTPTPPPQRQQQPQRPQQAQPNLPGIWAPGGVQLGRPAVPPTDRPQGRGTDLTVDPRFLEGTPRTDPSVRVTGAQVGADWRAAFRRWLDQNLSYPERARMLGEDGTVRVVVTAAPDGTVRNVRLAGPSTSPSLNFGTTFPFQGARLPAFPPGSDPNGVTIELTVNYILTRR